MGERRDGHECWNCKQLFALVYRAAGTEDFQASPVNCPGCGKLNYLPVPREVAVARLHRAELIERAVIEKQGNVHEQ